MPSDTPQTANPKVATIIVNYGTAALVLQNLPALIQEAQHHEGAHIYIVDNNSPGNDYETIKNFVETEALNSVVSVIDAGANLGFAGGNNIAFEKARAAGADFILCLNPDAALHPGALKTMVQFLEGHPKAAIVGPEIQDEHGAVCVSWHRFPTMLREFTSETHIILFNKLTGLSPDHMRPGLPSPTDWVSGAAFLVRTAAVPTKLMDDNFFLYYEETDMMLGMKQRGWEIWRTPDAKVVHIGGVSTGVQGEKAQLPTFWFDSWRYYFSKNHGKLYAVAAAFAKLLGIWTYVVKQALAGRKNERPAHYASDVFEQCLKPAVLGRDEKPTKPEAAT